MIKRLFFLLFFASLIMSQAARADHLTNVPMTIEQPDGTKFHCLASGDEFYNYLHDNKGYTIVLNPADGYFYYGIRQGDEVLPSKYLVNTVIPGEVGLIPGAKISENLYRQKREAFLAPMNMKGMTDAPTTGQVNQLSIYISFADDSIFETPREEYFDAYRAMDKPSLRHYYHEVSYERLFVDTYHYPNSPDTINVTYISEHPRAYFMPHSAANPDGYTGGQKTGREHTLLKNAIEFVRDQIPDSLDLDANNDGNVDNVCFTIKGGTTAWSTLLWPHRWSLYSQTASIRGLVVRDYLFMLEGTFEVSTLCHEFFHVLGAPDLYHYTDTGAPIACGPYDIMDQSSGHGYMGAFMKYKYGDWIASIPEINESGTYSIYPLQNPENNIYKISSPLHPSEYFILEYRKREGMYEASIPGEGLIVYRINPAAGNGNAGGPPDEIYVYRPGGTLTENGAFSNAPLGKTRFAMSDGTNPSSFLYNNGNSGKGGLDLFNVINYDDSITFEVNIVSLHAPVDLTYNLSDGEIDLDWLNLYTEGFEHYMIYKNDVLLATTNTSSFSDPDIQEGMSYSYYVTALYAGGPDGESEPSNIVSLTPKGIMTLPYSENFELSGHGWAILGSVNGFRWGNAELHEMNTDNETIFLAANSFANGYSANSKDMAITPRLDLSDYNSVTLGFDYTLKRLNSAEFLTIWIRRTPTDPWIELKKLGVSGFGPKYIWRTMSIDIPQDYYSGEVQVGFQYNDTEDLSYGTGIDNVLIQGIQTNTKLIENNSAYSIFPNPSDGGFNLQLTGISGETSIRILNLQGKEVWRKELFVQGVRHQETLDLKEMSDGIYVLIVHNQQNTFSEKLIKQSH
ncbi:MAG: M6 family metalloprotease domain-containing protein [Bacteroidales bacterium]|nr:M6 family metalloprotease domain-containing protein [Bacteroidales bacterium]